MLGIGDDPSWLLTNPPYGNRLAANEDLSPLYNQLASRLRHQDTFGGVIGSFTGLSQLFLRADFSHKSWYNGADPVVFYYKKPF